MRVQIILRPNWQSVLLDLLDETISLTATVFLGSAEQYSDKTFVKFNSVNNSHGYHLMNQYQLVAFSKTLVAVRRVHVKKY